MLLVFVVVELQNGDQTKQPIIVMADEEREQIAERDWVAMNNSLPNTQMATLHQMSPPSEQKAQDLIEANVQEKLEEVEQNTAQEKKIDEAIDLASQILELPEPNKVEKAAIEKKEPPKKDSAVQKIEQPPKPTQKTPLSFTQLAQGFMNQIAQVDIAVESNRQGPADMGMVVMVNYFQKVLKTIGESYSITNQMAPPDAQARDAHVMITLNKNGTIHSLDVTQSSGNQKVDSYLLQLVRHASSSFPPIPSSIKDSPLRIPTLQIRSIADFRHIHLWRIKA